MTEFFVFMYAMATGFVLMAMQRNKKQGRSNSQAMTMVGWGLFSLSSTLAVLMGAVALALALGLHMALPADFNAPIY